MASCPADRPGKFIVDSIHGAIRLSDRAVRVIDTASFQRLRQLKQLAMAQLVYPNATHTRFAHSIGTLGIMNRVLEVAADKFNDLNDKQKENLRLAALLHDIGHYPYSHMMESVDKVQLTEKWLEGKILDDSQVEYPPHEEIGRLIVTTQPDLIEAIGSKERAETVADLFTRTETTGSQFSKLVHSSLDLDRLDYLLRDSYATGVPYGRIDIHYLLNMLRVSPSGRVGFLEKALPAVEHFLLARFFMHRAVYYHKTTYGFEEVCRQLFRRLRGRGGENYGIPVDRKRIEEWVTKPELNTFTDSFVDKVIQEAAVKDGDKVIQALARSLQTRTPPKLLKEVPICVEKGTDYHAGNTFGLNCKNKLRQLAGEFDIPLGQFLLCNVPPITVGEHQQRLTSRQAAEHRPEDLRDRAAKEEEKDIRVFVADEPEPRSLMEIDHSVVPKFAQYPFQTFRLYVVYEGKDKDNVIGKLREKVKYWDKS